MRYSFRTHYKIISQFAFFSCKSTFLFYLIATVFYEFARESNSVSAACVLHFVSNKFGVSMAFRFRVNRRHRKDRQTECNTLSSPYKSIGYTPDCAQPGPVPWLTSLLSSKDSGGSMYIILVIFERLNCTNMGNILVVKKSL